MRKGYWKVLLRRLRSRMASGHNRFLSNQQQPLILTDVLASDDDALDLSDELALAATADGAVFCIDTGNNCVTLRAEGASTSESTGLDLPGFIDALRAGPGGAPGLALGLDDADLPEWRVPPGKSL